MKRCLLATFTIFLLAVSPSLASSGDLAIIVNQDNPTSDLSLKELVKIFKQEKQHWENGQKIYLVMLEAGTREKTLALKYIYKLPDEELKKYWLGKVFRQEIASFPHTVTSCETAKRFISQAPNAIGAIDQALADPRVKILKIDGKLPGQNGYPLSDQ